MIAAETVIRDIIAAHPSTIEVFEHYQIEFCCSGFQPLADACQAAGVAKDEVLASLRATEATIPAEEAPHWERASLRQLTGFIRSHHHEYSRRAIQEIRKLLPRVQATAGGEHLELNQISSLFAALAQDTLFHLAKEEHGLFPRIERLESISRGEALPATDAPAQRREGATIRVMMEDHDAAGAMMREIRRLSRDFMPPVAAGKEFQLLFRELAEFERDLHRHVHLENNVLFPRALQLEANLRKRPAAQLEPLG